MKILLKGLLATLAFNVVAEPIEYVITGETSTGETIIKVNFDNQDPALVESSPNSFAVPNGSATVTVNGNSYEFSNLNLHFVQGADWTGFTLQAQANDGASFEFNSGSHGYSLLNAVPSSFSAVDVELDGGWMYTGSPEPELSTSFLPHVPISFSSKYIDDSGADDNASTLTLKGRSETNGEPVEVSIAFDASSPNFAVTSQYGATTYDMPDAEINVIKNDFSFSLTGVSLTIYEAWGDFYITAYDGASGDIVIQGQAQDITDMDLTESHVVESVVDNVQITANQYTAPYFYINETIRNLPHLSEPPTLTLAAGSDEICNVNEKIEYSISTQNQFGPLNVTLTYAEDELIEIREQTSRYQYSSSNAVVEIINGPVLMTTVGAYLNYRPITPMAQDDGALSFETMQKAGDFLEQFRFDAIQSMGLHFAPDNKNVANANFDAVYSLLSTELHWFESGKLYGASVDKKLTPTSCD